LRLRDRADASPAPARSRAAGAPPILPSAPRDNSSNDDCALLPSQLPLGPLSAASIIPHNACGGVKQMDRPQSPLICCLYLLLIASALGCAAQERRKYDRWFPPGSTREQMIAKYGQPAWIVDRPSANPSDAEWRTAIDPKKEWMHPSVFVEDI